jgi:hypothetical protein
MGFLEKVGRARGFGLPFQPKAQGLNYFVNPGKVRFRIVHQTDLELEAHHSQVDADLFEEVTGSPEVVIIRRRRFSIGEGFENGSLHAGHDRVSFLEKED